MNLVRFSKIAGVAFGAFLLAACTGYDSSSSVASDTYEEPSGPVAGSQEDLEANVGDRIYYAFDRYDLNDTAQATLRRQGAWMKMHPSTTILIAGNCDERGTREYNLALGARRANSAKDFLTSLGVDPARISTISYGKERPTCMGSNEDCWAMNRNGITSVTGGPAS
jgi:peptidoglycan-associated lipoprotein